MKFHWSAASLLLDHSKLLTLAAQNMPFKVSQRAVEKLVGFVTSQSEPFHAFLTLPTGRPLSVAGGFIEKDLALMLYQFNDKEFRPLSPSLMLRSFLIEHLIQCGVRHLAFVGGCAGLFFHECVPVPAAELLIIGRTMSARARFMVGAMLAGNGNGRFVGSQFLNCIPVQPNTNNMWC